MAGLRRSKSIKPAILVKRRHAVAHLYCRHQQQQQQLERMSAGELPVLASTHGHRVRLVEDLAQLVGLQQSGRHLSFVVACTTTLPATITLHQRLAIYHIVVVRIQSDFYL